MAIAKVVEVNSSSNKSFEDAIQTGIAKVTETVKNVRVPGLMNKKLSTKTIKLLNIGSILKSVFWSNKYRTKKSPFEMGIFLCVLSYSDLGRSH